MRWLCMPAPIGICRPPIPAERAPRTASVYRAAAGEPRPVITGSERIDTWQPEGDGVWKAVIPNAFFNGYNPYVETVFGDWTVYPDPKVRYATWAMCI